MWGKQYYCDAIWPFNNSKESLLFFQAKLFLALAGLKNNNVGFCRQEQTLLF